VAENFIEKAPRELEVDFYCFQKTTYVLKSFVKIIGEYYEVLQVMISVSYDSVVIWASGGSACGIELKVERPK